MSALNVLLVESLSPASCLVLRERERQRERERERERKRKRERERENNEIMNTLY